MKHTVQSLTADVLVEMFGDSKDWYSVLKNGKRVGTFADLRKLVLKRQVLADHAERQKLAASLAKDDHIREAKRFFEGRIKNGEVFINETQPNVLINGCKVYIICGSSPKIRMGILHHSSTYEDMLIASGRDRAKPNSCKRHILFDGLDLEEAAELIDLLCGK